jgi:hypothetical protein
MSVWKPIEEVPKEHGQQILVRSEHGRAAVVTWLEQERVMHGREDGFVSGWYISDGHNDPIWYRAWHEITQWMRVPPGPIHTAEGALRTIINIVNKEPRRDTSQYGALIAVRLIAQNVLGPDPDK